MIGREVIQMQPSEEVVTLREMLDIHERSSKPTKAEQDKLRRLEHKLQQLRR